MKLRHVRALVPETVPLEQVIKAMKDLGLELSLLQDGTLLAKPPGFPNKEKMEADSKRKCGSVLFPHQMLKLFNVRSRQGGKR